MPLIHPRTSYWTPPDAAGDAEDGSARAGAVIARLQAGASDPDALLRSLLDCLAESGRVVAPDCRIRGFCRRLQIALTTKKVAAHEAAEGHDRASVLHSSAEPNSAGC